MSAENLDLDPHFSGRRRKLGFSGSRWRRHLGLGVFPVALLKAEQGTEKGFLLPCCILLTPNKLLKHFTILCCLLTCLYVWRMIGRELGKGRAHGVLGVPDRTGEKGPGSRG